MAVAMFHPKPKKTVSFLVRIHNKIIIKQESQESKGEKGLPKTRPAVLESLSLSLSLLLFKIPFRGVEEFEEPSFLYDTQNLPSPCLRAPPPSHHPFPWNKKYDLKNISQNTQMKPKCNPFRKNTLDAFFKCHKVPNVCLASIRSRSPTPTLILLVLKELLLLCKTICIGAAI